MPHIRVSKETSHFNHYYRLVVHVTATVDIDRNVFLYLAAPPRDGAADREGLFQGVCSPKDMVDWPAGEPLDNAEPPWVRYDTLDLLFPCLSEMTSAWTLIQDELATLCTTMEALERLTSSEVVEFGVLPGESFPGHY